MERIVMSLAIIDADSLYFRICYKTKSKKEIRKNIELILSEIERETFMSDMKIAVKGRGNWRKEYYPEYKKNRKELEPDLKEALNYAHNHLVKKYGAIQADGMEADDLVSIWAYEAREMEIPYIIVGIDKDLLQIPGNHYNFVKREHQFIDDDMAYRKLMLQCLTGDNSDNIPGIKGIGPKKAEKIFGNATNDRLWTLVRAAWEMHGAGKPDVSYRLLKMLTDWEEYDKVQRSIKSKTTESEQSMEPEGVQEVQVSGLQEVPDTSEGTTEGSGVAVREGSEVKPETNSGSVQLSIGS